MGLKGPQRQPGKRIEDKATVRVKEIVGSEPVMPHGLTMNAQRIWTDTVTYLRDDGRLHANQGPLIERFAITVDRAKIVDAVIEVEGLMVDGKPHSLLSTSIALAEKIRMMARELGMTPASRLPTLVPAERPELAPVSPIEALMRRREMRA